MKKLVTIIKTLIKLIQSNQFVLYLLMFFVIYFIYLFIQSTSSFLDPDSFYHLKMSKLIAERGPIFDFPWLHYTVLKEYYIDHHFLYHVAGIPFIKVLGDFIGFKWFTACLATLFAFFSYLFFKKLNIRYPEFFTLVLVTAPALLFRISLGKATAFSLLILFIGIYCIFKRKYWLLGIVSFIFVWSYGGFLLILLITLLYVLANIIYNTFSSQGLVQSIKQRLNIYEVKDYLKKFWQSIFLTENIKLVSATVIGLVSGFILNPYFPNNFKFIYQQLFQIGLVNYQGIVNVGGEWYPYHFIQLMQDSSLSIVLGVVAIILFIVFIKKQKAESIFFLLTTVLFFLLTLKSKRYVEYFVPFLTFFAAFTVTYVFGQFDIKKFLNKFSKTSKLTGKATIVLIVIICLIFPIIMYNDVYRASLSFKSGYKWQKFSGIASYLYENSEEKDIIMHTDWDDFPSLFYYNHKNYYIMGLDPTFMYNYDPELYHLFADITTSKKTDNVYNEVKDNFKAKYFIVNEDRDKLNQTLSRTPGFIKVYQDNDGTIFKLE